MKKSTINILLTIMASTTMSVSAWAQSTDLLKVLSKKDSQDGFKQALTQAAEKTVTTLSTLEGFMGNPQVKIGLPQPLNKVAKTLKTFGMGKQIDELELRMNRAASMAVPEAKALLKQSINTMSVMDAKNIVQGGPTSATDYFRTKTSASLAVKFLPIIQKSMENVKIADSYNALAGKASDMGLMSKDSATLDQHITQKTLDGLYLLMAEEEKHLRENPKEAIGVMAKKLFSALK